MSTPAPRSDGALHRAANLAVSSVDIGEALGHVLAEAVPALGVRAGIVLDGSSPSCRAAWGVEGEALERLLTPALRAHVAGLGPAATPARVALAGGQQATLLPLQVRGIPAGALLLLGCTDEAPDAEAADGFAGLCALVLDNGRLYEEARAAEQARDRFLTALNHELRTPATAFALTADLLHAEPEGTLPARLERLLHDADSYLQQLVGVLRRVLDLGRLGELANPEQVDLLHPRDAIAELMRRIEPTAAKKHLSLRLYVPRHLPPLQTDGTRFSRILLHLLSNAVKYTSQGGIEVRVEREREVLLGSRPEPVLLIRVRDTGCGIPAHEIERVFQPFAQVDEGARTDSMVRGQGLGLPLALRLARSLGGDVRIESTLGTGTTATLVLPYRRHETG